MDILQVGTRMFSLSADICQVSTSLFSTTFKHSSEEHHHNNYFQMSMVLCYSCVGALQEPRDLSTELCTCAR